MAVADVLRWTEVALLEAEAGLEEGRSPGYFDPGYDVEFAEDLFGIHGQDQDVNNLVAIEMAVRAGLPVIGWAPARRNPGEDERVDRAARQFSTATSRLLDDFRSGLITSEQLSSGITAAFIRQSRNAFMAGKRALGNLRPMTVEDEVDLARAARAAGFTDKPDPRSFGAVLQSLASREPSSLPPDTRERMDEYIADLMERVMDFGFSRANEEQQRALEALRMAAATGSTAALAALTAAQQSQAPDLAAWQAAYAAAQRQQAAAEAALRRQERLVREARKSLADAIRKAQKRATGSFQQRLGVLLRKVLDGRIDPAAAAAELQDLLRAQARRAYKDARRLVPGAPSSRKPITPEEEDGIADTEDDASGDFLDSLPPAAKAGAGAAALSYLLYGIFLDPLNLIDPDVIRWYDRRLKGLASRFYSISRMGEQAAFRLGGTPAKAAVGQTAAELASQMATEPRQPVSTGTSGTTQGATIVWWRLGDAAQHCENCLSLADGSPYRLAEFAALGIFPGSGHTECGPYCRCGLEYDVPTVVCGDTVLAESSEGGAIEDVWFMEASDCANPLTLDGLALGQGLGYQTEPISYLSNEDAFDWDADIATHVTLGAVSTGLPAKVSWLNDPPKGAKPYLLPWAPVSVRRLTFGNAAYDAVYQESSDAIRFVMGYMADGPGVYYAEMTVAAIRNLAARAAVTGKSLEFDPRLVNEGMRAFLSDIGAHWSPSVASMWDPDFMDIHPPKAYGQAKPYGIPLTPFEGQEWLIPQAGGLPTDLVDLPGSTLPLNAPLQPWSGRRPFTEPPLPPNVILPSQLAALRKASDEAWYRWEDVKAKKVAYALIDYSQRSAAEHAGLVVKQVSGRWYATTSTKRAEALANLIRGGVDPNSDWFWENWLGYSKARLSAIDAYTAASKQQTLRAGVLVMEDDGRVWFLAPRNQYAGYENTWSKGAVDANETPAEAAVREAREEMGLSVELVDYLGDFANSSNTSMSRYYIGRRTGGGPAFLTTPKETYAVRLGTPEQVLPVLKRYGKPDSRDVAILDAYRQYLGLPPLSAAEAPSRAAYQSIWTQYDIPAGIIDQPHFMDVKGTWTVNEQVMRYDASYAGPEGKLTFTTSAPILGTSVRLHSWSGSFTTDDVTTLRGLLLAEVMRLKDELGGALPQWLNKTTVRVHSDLVTLVHLDAFLSDLGAAEEAGQWVLDAQTLNAIDVALTAGHLPGPPSISLTSDEAGALAATLTPDDAMAAAMAGATSATPPSLSTTFGYSKPGLDIASASVMGDIVTTPGAAAVSEKHLLSLALPGGGSVGFPYFVLPKGTDWVTIAQVKSLPALETMSLAARREYVLAYIDYIIDPVRWEGWGKSVLKLDNSVVQLAGLEEMLTVFGATKSSYTEFWSLPAPGIVSLRTALASDALPATVSHIPAAPLSHGAAAAAANPLVSHVPVPAAKPYDLDGLFPVIDPAEAPTYSLAQSATTGGGDAIWTYTVKAADQTEYAFDTMRKGSVMRIIKAPTDAPVAVWYRALKGMNDDLLGLATASLRFSDDVAAAMPPDVLALLTPSKWMDDLEVDGSALIYKMNDWDDVIATATKPDPNWVSGLSLDEALGYDLAVAKSYTEVGWDLGGTGLAIEAALPANVVLTGPSKVKFAVIPGTGAIAMDGAGLGNEMTATIGALANLPTAFAKVTPQPSWGPLPMIGWSVLVPKSLLDTNEFLADILKQAGGLVVGGGDIAIHMSDLTALSTNLLSGAPLPLVAGKAAPVPHSTLLGSLGWSEGFGPPPEWFDAVSQQLLTQPGSKASPQSVWWQWSLSTPPLAWGALPVEWQPAVALSQFPATQFANLVGDVPALKPAFVLNLSNLATKTAPYREAQLLAGFLKAHSLYPDAYVLVQPAVLNKAIGAIDDPFRAAFNALADPELLEDYWVFTPADVKAIADDLIGSLKASPVIVTAPLPTSTSLKQAASLTDEDMGQLMLAPEQMHLVAGAGGEAWNWPGPDGSMWVTVVPPIIANKGLLTIDGTNHAFWSSDAKWELLAGLQQATTLHPGVGVILGPGTGIDQPEMSDLKAALKAIGMSDDNTLSPAVMDQFAAQLSSEWGTATTAVPAGQMAGAPVAAPLAPGATPPPPSILNLGPTYSPDVAQTYHVVGEAVIKDEMYGVKPTNNLLHLWTYGPDIDHPVGNVIGRRLGNRYEIFDVYSPLGANPDPAGVFVAHMRFLDAQFDKYPKLTHVAIHNVPAEAGQQGWLDNLPDLNWTLETVGGTTPSGTMKLTPAQVKTFLSEIDADAEKVIAWKAAAAPSPGQVAPAPGVPDVPPTVVPPPPAPMPAAPAAPAFHSPFAQTKQYDPVYAKSVAPSAEQTTSPAELAHYAADKAKKVKASAYGSHPGGLLTTWRHIGDRIEIHHVITYDASGNLVDRNILLGHLLRMADLAEKNKSVKYLTYWYPAELPDDFRAALTAAGATTDAASGRMRLSTAQLLAIRDGVKADAGLPVFIPAAPSPPLVVTVAGGVPWGSAPVSVEPLPATFNSTWGELQTVADSIGASVLGPTFTVDGQKVIVQTAFLYDGSVIVKGMTYGAGKGTPGPLSSSPALLAYITKMAPGVSPSGVYVHPDVIASLHDDLSVALMQGGYLTSSGQMLDDVPLWVIPPDKVAAIKASMPTAAVPVAPPGAFDWMQPIHKEGLKHIIDIGPSGVFTKGWEWTGLGKVDVTDVADVTTLLGAVPYGAGLGMLPSEAQGMLLLAALTYADPDVPHYVAKSFLAQTPPGLQQAVMNIAVPPSYAAAMSDYVLIPKGALPSLSMDVNLALNGPPASFATPLDVLDLPVMAPSSLHTGAKSLTWSDGTIMHVGPGSGSSANKWAIYSVVDAKDLSEAQVKGMLAVLKAEQPGWGVYLDYADVNNWVPSQAPALKQVAGLPEVTASITLTPEQVTAYLGPAAPTAVPTPAVAVPTPGVLVTAATKEDATVFTFPDGKSVPMGQKADAWWAHTVVKDTSGSGLDVKLTKEEAQGFFAALLKADPNKGLLIDQTDLSFSWSALASDIETIGVVGAHPDMPEGYLISPAAMAQYVGAAAPAAPLAAANIAMPSPSASVALGHPGYSWAATGHSVAIDTSAQTGNWWLPTAIGGTGPLDTDEVKGLFATLIAADPAKSLQLDFSDFQHKFPAQKEALKALSSGPDAGAEAILTPAAMQQYIGAAVPAAPSPTAATNDAVAIIPPTATVPHYVIGQNFSGGVEPTAAHVWAALQYAQPTPGQSIWLDKGLAEKVGIAHVLVGAGAKLDEGFLAIDAPVLSKVGIPSAGAVPTPAPTTLVSGADQTLLAHLLATPPTPYGKGWSQSWKWSPGKHKLGAGSSPQKMHFSQSYSGTFKTNWYWSDSKQKPIVLSYLHELASKAAAQTQTIENALVIDAMWMTKTDMADLVGLWGTALGAKPSSTTYNGVLGWSFTKEQAQAIATAIESNTAPMLPPVSIFPNSPSGAQAQAMVAKVKSLNPSQKWEYGDPTYGKLKVSLGPKTYGLTNKVTYQKPKSAVIEWLFESSTVLVQVPSKTAYYEPIASVDVLGAFLATALKTADSVKTSGKSVKVFLPSMEMTDPDFDHLHKVLLAVGGQPPISGAQNTLVLTNDQWSAFVKAIDDGTLPAGVALPSTAASPTLAAPTPSVTPSPPTVAAPPPPSPVYTPPPSYVPKPKEPPPPVPSTLWVPPTQAADAHAAATHVRVPTDQKVSTELGFDGEEKAMFSALGYSDYNLPEVTTGLIPQQPKGMRWTTSGGKKVEVSWASTPSGSLTVLTGVSGEATEAAQEAALYASVQELAAKVADKGTGYLYITDDVYASRPALRDRLLALGGHDIKGEILDPAAIAADPMAEAAIKVVNVTTGEEIKGRNFWRAYGDGIRLDASQADVLRKGIDADTFDPALQGQVLAQATAAPVLKAVPAGATDRQPIRYLGVHPDHLYMAGSENITQRGVRAVSRWANNTVEAEWLRTPNIIEWHTLKVVGSDVPDVSVRAAAIRQLDVMLEDLQQSPGVIMDVYSPVWEDVPELRDLLLRYDARELHIGDRHFIRVNTQDSQRLLDDLRLELGGVRKPVVPPPIWPNPSDLRRVHADLGGQQKKYKFADGAGNEYMFKVGNTGRGPHTDWVVSQLANRFGLRIPPTKEYVLVIDGVEQRGGLQLLVPNLRGLNTATRDMDESQLRAMRPSQYLSPEQQRELHRHSILDWLVANDDSHGNNFLIDEVSGDLWAIDKTRSWRGMKGPYDSLDIDNPSRKGTGSLIAKWWQEVRAGDTSLLGNVSPKDYGRVLRQIEDMTDDEFLAVLKPILDDWQTLEQFRSRDAFVRAVLDRKHSLKADFEANIKKVLEQARTKGQLPAEWQAWLDEGAQFRLLRTQPELAQERMTELAARFGEVPVWTSDSQFEEWTKRLLSRADELAQPLPGQQKALSWQVENALSRAMSYSGGGLTGEVIGPNPARGVHMYHSEATKTQQNEAGYNLIRDINEYLTLNMLFNPNLANMPYARELRAAYNPEDGTLIFRRAVAGWTSPARYVDSKLGWGAGGQELRPLMGWSYGPGKPGYIQSSEHVVLTGRVRPEQVWLSSVYFPSRFGHDRGEREAMLADVTKTQVFHIGKPYHSWPDELGISYSLTSTDAASDEKRRRLYDHLHHYSGSLY